MKPKIALFIALLSGVVLVAAAFGDTSSTAGAGAPKGTLVALGKTALGKVLVDARGRTLYLFEKDKRGVSACFGACATYWPPLLSPAKARPGSGVRASLLGVTRRANGKRQVTYAGHPLYTYAGDTKAGQTAGEGLKNFGASWDVVSATGRAVEPPTSDSGGAGTGYGGGYGG